MSAANPICGIRGICESPGCVATHNPREYRPGGLCVIRGICETFPEIHLINLRDFTL